MENLVEFYKHILRDNLHEFVSTGIAVEIHKATNRPDVSLGTRPLAPRYPKARSNSAASRGTAPKPLGAFSTSQPRGGPRPLGALLALYGILDSWSADTEKTETEEELLQQFIEDQMLQRAQQVPKENNRKDRVAAAEALRLKYEAADKAADEPVPQLALPQLAQKKKLRKIVDTAKVPKLARQRYKRIMKIVDTATVPPIVATVPATVPIPTSLPSSPREIGRYIQGIPGYIRSLDHPSTLKNHLNEN